ncbi:diacylglycerol kinase family protein [Bacillus suaedaesalsae]|uniref:Diacylglycerol kinase family protein n=1 Tax=Bacillus suaedaesalsae TaxID=2810349 RepID=A0ABS2DLG9_9BACI|nr:diacylglycerol kinase family protein [Bacillus suaedaesalsae]MBM6619261.1 diacylglycerol kinase family protein [Bacillus suaedaesalsae]
MNRSWNRFIHSFKYASMGIIHALKTEQNIRIHLLAGIIVFILAFIVKVSAIEWTILLLLISGIIVLELVNTAIERTVDLATNKEYHLLAKQAKDLAAGAVLVYAVTAIIIGLIIFGKAIMKYINPL